MQRLISAFVDLRVVGRARVVRVRASGAVAERGLPVLWHARERRPRDVLSALQVSGALRHFVPFPALPALRVPVRIILARRERVADQPCDVIAKDLLRPRGAPAELLLLRGHFEMPFLDSARADSACYAFSPVAFSHYCEA